MTLGLGIGLSDAWRLDSGGFFSGATLDMGFARGAYLGAAPANLTVTRSGTNATDLTYDQTSRTGYNSYAANTPAIDQSAARGLGSWESRTQYLGVTDAPANQTTSSLGTGSYTLWCIGGTSVTVSAGSATITGAGSATPGTPLTFTVTVAGTVTVTVSGAVRFFQLENGAFATPYIPNAGAAGTTSTRSADLIVLSGSAFSSWFTNSSAWTFYGEWLLPHAVPAANAAVMEANDGTTNNRSLLRGTTGATAAQSTQRSGAATVFQQSSTKTTTAFNVFKGGMAQAASNFGFSVNGETPITQASGAVATGLNQLVIGSEAGPTGYLNGFVRRIAHKPVRDVDATLQATTT